MKKKKKVRRGFGGHEWCECMPQKKKPLVCAVWAESTGEGKVDR